MKKILSLLLVFVLMFTMSVSAFASDNYDWDTSLPDIPDTEKAEYPYVVVHRFKASDNSQRAQLYMTKEPLTIASDGLLLPYTGKFLVYNYGYDNSQSWTKLSPQNGTLGMTLIASWVKDEMVNGNSLLQGNYNLSGYVNGDSNFGKTTLVQEVQKVTEQAMAVEMSKMGETAQLLTACGVGLMALLIGLALFGKRSLLSLR